MTGHVAYQGVPGAYGEQACRAFLPGWAPVPCPTFADVVETVLAGGAGRGMLPLRNEIAGDVPGMAALLEDDRLAVVSRHSLPVRLHLLAIPGARRASIRTVSSHEMAIAQCRLWLDAIGIEAEPAPNTALAARMLAASGDRTRGVLASASAAEHYGLTILQRDVQDRDDNMTTFGIVARAGEPG